MAQYFIIHPDNPQPRLIRRAAEIVREGGVIVYPTDSCYALGCHLGDKEAMDRIRLIRQMDDRHHLTLMVRDLSEIAHFARLARHYAFHASRGSDFHGPEESYVDLGKLPQLPEDLKPVWRLIR